MSSTSTNLTNINFMSQERFDNLTTINDNELYAVKINSVINGNIPDYSRSISVSTGTEVQEVLVDSELRVFFTNSTQEGSWAQIYISLCDVNGTVTKSGIICCRAGYEGAPSTASAILETGTYFKVETWSNLLTGTTLQLTPLKGV